VRARRSYRRPIVFECIRRYRRFVALLFALSVVMSSNAADDGYALLVARVASAKYLGDASSVDEESWHFVMIDRYNVKLRDIRVVEGDYEPGASLELELLDYTSPSSRGRFTRAPEIYVVLKLDPAGKPTVEDWGPVVRIVCLHDNDLELYGLGESFDSDYEQTYAGGASCAELE
jgi:hypothetical protein